MGLVEEWLFKELEIVQKDEWRTTRARRCCSKSDCELFKEAGTAFIALQPIISLDAPECRYR